MTKIIPENNIVLIEYSYTKLYSKYINIHFNFFGLKIPIKTGFYHNSEYINENKLQYSNLVYDNINNVINTKPVCIIHYMYNTHYIKQIYKYFNDNKELDNYLESVLKDININLIKIL